MNMRSKALHSAAAIQTNDPVFAALTAYRAARKAWEQTIEPFNEAHEGEGADQTVRAATAKLYNETSARADEALKTLCQTVPTTQAGVAALAKFGSDNYEEELAGVRWNANEVIFGTIAKAVKRLAKREPAELPREAQPNASSENSAGAQPDPVITASTRLFLAMAHHEAACSITGPMFPGPDEDAAHAIQVQLSQERDEAAKAFAACRPKTPMAFLIYLQTFATAMEQKHRLTFDHGDDLEITEPTVWTVAHGIVEAFEAIFLTEGGAVLPAPQPAHRSKALAEDQVLARMNGLSDAIPSWEIHSALESDDALIAFAIKHDESLDWIIRGDESARRHRQDRQNRN